MGRPVMLGNGQLTVGLNEQGLVHDFYYPYVGLDNLSTARSSGHKIGVWVDGKFSWVDDNTWDINVDFFADALISKITMEHKALEISLAFQDFVDTGVNAFCRQIVVTNNSARKREVRLFMHQVFEISRQGRADTAIFVPEENYILDYKGRYSLIVYGQDSRGNIFDQFAIGNYGIEGKEGTFKDAEDGQLSGSPVEHGGVDSVIRFVMPLEAGGNETIDYWVIAADSQYSAEKLLLKLKSDTLSKRLEDTRDYWHNWLGIAAKGLHSIDQKYMDMTKKSLMMIKVHTDKRGGIIASCDSSIYNYGRDYYSYVWPRDGAFAIWPLIRLGYSDEPKRFFEFCRDILTEDGYLMHKYQPDRAIGSTWHPLLHGRHSELAIQEDETAVVIYMLGEYLSYSKDKDFVLNLYSTLIQPACNFMVNFVDETTNLPHASYDLWEEKFLTNTYTVMIVYQALLVGSDLAETFEYPDDAIAWRDAAERISENSGPLFNTELGSYRKGYLLKEDNTIEYDDTLDVSTMYGAMMFGGKSFDLTKLEATVTRIEAVLLDQSPIGGSPRYEHDNYFASQPAFQGNPWIVTTLWIAQYYIRVNNTERATYFVDWSINHAMPSGVLPEQLNPSNGQPISVSPLVWSHAELVNTILDIIKL
jgi:GH15 family glucan-1,4-alpha-glucosidase